MQDIQGESLYMIIKGYTIYDTTAVYVSVVCFVGVILEIGKPDWQFRNLPNFPFTQANTTYSQDNRTRSSSRETIVRGPSLTKKHNKHNYV